MVNIERGKCLKFMKITIIKIVFVFNKVCYNIDEFLELPYGSTLPNYTLNKHL